jgi:serine/threonine protein kinase
LIIDDSTGRDVVKVVDFGLAHALAPDVAIADPRRALPLYAAPERFAGRTIDARTDLYAFGCILYELLSGKPLFEAATLDALAARHHREKPPALPPNVPASLLAIVQKLLAKTPGERFASCKELRSRLLPVQAEVGEPPSQHHSGPIRAVTPTGAPSVQRDPTTPPSTPPTPPSMPPYFTRDPTTPPSTPPTARVPPLAPQPRSGGRRILVIALVALLTSGAAIGVYLATQGL